MGLLRSHHFKHSGSIQHGHFSISSAQQKERAAREHVTVPCLLCYKSLLLHSLGFMLAVLTVQQRPLGPCGCMQHLSLDANQAGSCCGVSNGALLHSGADNISQPFNWLPVFSFLKSVLSYLANRGSRGKQSFPWSGVQSMALFRCRSQGISI